MTRRLFKHIFVVAGASYVCEALFLLRGVLLARFLAPMAFGVWSSMRLVMLFGRLSGLGALSGLLQRAPHAVGAGLHERAAHYPRVTSGIMLLGALLFALVLAVVAMLAGAVHAAWWYALGAVLVASQAHRTYQAFLIAKGRFPWAGFMAIGMALLSTAGGAWAAYRFGLGGFLVALAASFVVMLVVGSVFGPTFPRPSLHRARAMEIVRTGVPIMAGDSTQLLMWNVDKLVLWLLVGTTAMGIYAVQAYLTAAVMLLPTAVLTVLRPHLAEQAGRDASAAAMRPYLERGTRLVSHLALPLLGVLFLLMHYPIRWALPAFVATIEPGRIMMLAAYFSVVGTVPATILVATDRHAKLLRIRLIGAAIASAGAVLVLRNGGWYQGVALCMGLGFFTTTALTLRAAGGGGRLALSLFLPFVALLATLLLADVFLMGDGLPGAAMVGILFGGWAYGSARRLLRTEPPDVLSSIDEIDAAEWDAVAGSHWQTRHTCLRTFEQYPVRGVTPRYVVVRKDGELVAAAVCQVCGKNSAAFLHDSLLLGRLRGTGVSFLPAVVCSAMHHPGAHLFVHPRLEGEERGRRRQELLEKVEAFALSKSMALHVPRVEEGEPETRRLLARRGYHHTLQHPIAYLDIEWDCFDGYLGYVRSFSSRVAQNIRWEISRNSRAGVRIETIDDVEAHIARICELLDNHNRRHNDAPWPYPRQLLTTLENAVFFGAFKGDELVGVAIMTIEGDRARACFIGVDHEKVAGDLTYFNVAYYRPIAEAIARGCKRIDYGVGMYSLKARRGCRTERVEFFYRGAGPVRHLALAPWFAFHTRWMRRKFKDHRSLDQLRKIGAK